MVFSMAILGKTYIYQKIPKDIMHTQVNIRMTDELLHKAQAKAKKRGFGSVQEFIRDLVREDVYEYDDSLTKEERELIDRMLALRHKKEAWGTEEDLWKALSKK